MAVLLLTSLVALSFGLAAVWHAVVWWRQRMFQAFMEKQGMRGPPPGWIAVGNIIQQFKLREGTRLKGMPCSGISHDIVSQVTPEYTFYSSLYGKQYLSWWFSEPRVTVVDPESVKEVMSKQFSNFPKSQKQLEFVLDFVGKGIIGANGDEWFHRRSALSPAFQTHKVKRMVSSVQNCTEKLIESWTSYVAAHAQTEVEVFSAIKTLAADIISHTAFGSSYAKGERVFEGLTAFSGLFTERIRFSWLPFFRYLPTPVNFRTWKLRRELDELLLSLIRERRSLFRSGAALSYGNDLLGLMLEESEKPGNDCRFFDDKAIVGECKTFYTAGHETTASLISWTLLLLAINPDWQERARAEAQEHCSDDFQDGEALGKLKVLTMILYESLRLYTPATEVNRAAATDTYLNGLKIPRGTGVTIPILSLHHDKELWGEDANEFKPDRFSQGAAKAANHPNAFVPFMLGPRVCIGQTFALMEAKVVVAMLLRKFSFGVSPGYRHNPTVKIVIVPAHGMQLLLKRI